jgi:FKBP-type peptidyl-prolyl cis-trans isomerase FkpA
MKRTAFLITALLATVSCNDEITGLGPPSDPATETFAPSLSINISQMTRLPSGVYIQDLVVGTGDSITARTDSLWLTYTGFLKTGTSFDDGVNTLFQPAFVIPGFIDGLLGLRVGGRRRIVIPSALGYGGRSVKDADGKIIVPRQSTLIFNVELLKVHNVEPTPPAT